MNQDGQRELLLAVRSKPGVSCHDRQILHPRMVGTALSVRFERFEDAAVAARGHVRATEGDDPG
jgi:hypothetical protein